MNIDERDLEYLSDLMDMYGNYVITKSDYFRKAVIEQNIPYPVVEEYFDEAKWRVKKRKYQ